MGTLSLFPYLPRASPDAPTELGKLDLSPALGSGSLTGHAGGIWAALQMGEALGWVFFFNNTYAFQFKIMLLTCMLLPENSCNAEK